MNSKFALSIAAAVMLVVLAMLGEGGAVSNIAQADAAQTEQARRMLSRGSGDPQPVSAPGASSPWAVSADTPATPHGASITAASAIPVYEYRNVPVAIPQEIIDPDKAAASPIR